MYLLFSAEHYYAGGGIADLVGIFETVEDAIYTAKELRDDWFHVFDAESQMIVAQSRCFAYGGYIDDDKISSDVRIFEWVPNKDVENWKCLGDWVELVKEVSDE
jgi:hypothetical protein